MKSVPGQSVSKQTVQRLPTYLSYLKGLQGDSKHISATAIAEALNINHVVVRKDLASISSSGRPKVGYVREDLIRELLGQKFSPFSGSPNGLFPASGIQYLLP